MTSLEALKLIVDMMIAEGHTDIVLHTERGVVSSITLEPAVTEDGVTLPAHIWIG